MARARIRGELYPILIKVDGAVRTPGLHLQVQDLRQSVRQLSEANSEFARL